METKDRHLISIGLVLTSLVGFLGVYGCAHRPPAVIKINPPLAPEVRAQLGTIGILWADRDPFLKHDDPVKGAWAGAGRGAGGAITGWFRSLPRGGSGDLFTGIVGIIGITLGITFVPLVGAGAGAVAAPSPAAVEEATAALKQAQEELWTAERIQDRVFEAAREHRPYSFTNLPRPAPSVPEERLAEPKYQALSSDGVTTAMELWYPVLLLETEKTGVRINPDLHLTMHLASRLVRTADNTVLYWHMAEYRSTEARTLVEWAANGAQTFRAEVEAGLQAVVTELLDRLFLAEAPGDAGSM